MGKKCFNKPQTICWDCSNACGNRCSWSKDLVPVDGWTVEETSTGVRVTACPQFRRDSAISKKDPDELDTDGCIELLKAAGRLMYTDYISGEGVYKYDRHMPETIMETMKKNRREIERFILSDCGRKMLMITNPESVVHELRRLAEIHDANEMEVDEYV